ncbi:formate dehydrogenase subunit gamma [Dokdonella sp.]|uniref:formate dehydrogenase subunit gamma n=1 Tax=Dokdonella sp. TaxID=2291710 RepID=UPI003C35F642
MPELEPSARSSISGSSLEEAARIAVLRAIDSESGKADSLLPILHRIQDAIGHVPAAAVPLVAGALNLSRAEVHGVVSFYHHFRSEAPGRHVLKLCRAEACQAMGARHLERHLKERLAIEFGATTEDGGITLEAVYCLGNCACAPSAMLDDTVHGRLSIEKLDRIVDACGNGT